ncbi:PLP-dependent cysteine synthase family protein [Geothrix sp. 21YS21S-2]|uniref:PLP-dependent cysteine synthase family protein n=1 Tax=Geothrix sp. 21YS21S-2 TaxID=3068893 RepID=UPI0027B8F2AA|nr:cysteine synthase family protein [Geothrix sp. 21YS21S-2]
MRDKRVYDSLLDVIGNTPLVRLRRITAGMPFPVWVKLEYLNPMGSSKDRIAKYLVEQAEKDGRLQPGDVILENSSGNTAMGLALAAIQKGYTLKAVVRDRTSKEKLDQLTALGVDVVRVDTSLPPEHPDSYNLITPRLARETPHCYFPDQHNNRENNEAHYLGTGPEVWDQMDGRIDVFVAGMGTGGTIGGVGRYLKERNPAVRIVAVDVVGSVFTPFFKTGEPGKAAPYLLEGLGDEFLIGCADFSVIDEMVQVSDRDAFLAARELARTEGLLVGGSSGAVIHALRRIAPTLAPDARVAILFPDSASRYLSTIFNDDWMREKGMLD